MSLNVTFNGSNYIIPETGEVGWGGNTTSYLVAIAAGALQKTGGNFTLSADTDFGASFGLKSLYYKSRSSNIAATGIVRLNNNSDAISWRNAANSGDLALNVSAANELVFNGVVISTGGGVVSPGTQYQLGYYAANGSTISGLTLITASRALQSDANGLPVASTVTATELGYVSGVTSSIQTQLNNKVPPTRLINAGTGLTGGGDLSADVTLSLAIPVTVVNGGTGQTSYTNGQLLIGNTTGNTLTKATLTGTTNQVNITNGTGSITLSTPQDIAPASSPTFAAATLTAVSNQLILGTTRTVTFNAPTPASASRTYTFPDLSANYSIVGTEGAQTINGIKTLTSPVFIGPNTSTGSVDSWVTINRAADNTVVGNGHAFSDSSSLNRTGGIAYNSYDANITVSGSQNYDHVSGFQSRPTIGTSGTTNGYFGHTSNPIINSGTITNAYHYHVSDPTGTGAITNQYGLYVSSLTKGSSTNFAVYTDGTTPSFFGGNVYTVPYTDYSGTTTTVGWASFSTKELRYKKIGKLVYVMFRLVGTSNATTTSFTLPSTPVTGSTFRFAAKGTDNSVSLTTPSSGIILAGSTTVTFNSDYADALWTASGTKQVSGEVFYEEA